LRIGGAARISSSSAGSLLIAFGFPTASGKGEYAALVALLCLIEGVALVAAPGLICDFSPQLARGAALGF
jgi:MFS transporter, ACS family, D-galactonate transporter